MVGSGTAEKLPFSTAVRNVQGHCRSCSAKSRPWNFQDFQICCGRNVKKCKLWEVKNPRGSSYTKPVRKHGDTCATVREIHCQGSGQQAFTGLHVPSQMLLSDWVMPSALKSVSWGVKIIWDSSHGTHLEHGLSLSWPSVVTCKLAFSSECEVSSLSSEQNCLQRMWHKWGGSRPCLATFTLTV